MAQTAFFKAISKFCTTLLSRKTTTTTRDVAAAPQTPQLGGAQANFGGPS